MKRILLFLFVLIGFISANAQEAGNYYLYAYDNTNSANIYIPLTSTDGDMFSATGYTLNASTDLNCIQVIYGNWEKTYAPAAGTWPKVKLGTVISLEDGGTGSGWIYGWTLSESNYIFFQLSTLKLAISANSENPITSSGGSSSDYEELFVYAYDVTNSANVNIPLTTTDGENYSATGYAFPSGATDGFKSVQVRNSDWTKTWNAADEEYPQITLSEPVTLVQGGKGEAWIIGWTPQATSTFTFNTTTGVLCITDPNYQTVTVGTQGISSFCSTNDLDFSSATNVEAYTATSVNGTTVNLTKVEKVPAGTGVMLKSKDGSANVTEMIPVAESVTAISGNMLVAAPKGSTIKASADGTYNYVFGTVGTVKGFYKLVDNDIESTGNFAYLQSTEDYLATNGAKAMTLSFGDATVISTAKADSTTQQAIYTISGQRVDNMSKAGLYIVNGKKIIVK